MNNENFLLDLINIKRKQTTRSEVCIKYKINETMFEKKKRDFVTKYEIDPRVVYFKNEIDEELKKLQNNKDINLKVSDLLERIRKFDQTFENSFVTKRRSVCTNKDGEVTMVWTRESLDETKYHEAKIKAIQKLCENIHPISKIKLRNEYKFTKTKNDYAVLLPLADMHLGVKIEASRAKLNRDWGILEAKEAFTKSLEYVLNTAPAARELIIADLGDILHMADNTMKTPGHGHPLDADCSMETSMDVLFELLYNLIDTALQKYEKIYLYSVPGNHNMDISYVIKEVVRQRYRNMSDRVIVGAYRDHTNICYHKFGKNLIGFTHGDEIKKHSLETIFWSDNKEDISKFDNYDAYSGHIHQDKLITQGMVTMRVIKNFAPNDKWADSMGFRNIKHPGFMQAFVYHKDQGVVSNIMYNPVD